MSKPIPRNFITTSRKIYRYSFGVITKQNIYQQIKAVEEGVANTKLFTPSMRLRLPPQPLVIDRRQLSDRADLIHVRIRDRPPSIFDTPQPEDNLLEADSWLVSYLEAKQGKEIWLRAFNQSTEREAFIRFQVFDNRQSIVEAESSKDATIERTIKFDLETISDQIDANSVSTVEVRIRVSCQYPTIDIENLTPQRPHSSVHVYGKTHRECTFDNFEYYGEDISIVNYTPA